MPKFSVKRPYTILVAAVIIIVLGIVSFFKMTPDLLPNMDFPYVVVVTTYPGATPEKVESSVTKPMEAQMATLTNIKNISSTSNENYSMVVLEFTNDVNMDTVSVDILQKINTISGSWDELVGTPMILKINPSMMPVMVASISKEGLSSTELSAFVDKNVMTSLEGTTGVASVSTSGKVQQQMNVVISQKKINKITQKIYSAIDSQFASAESKLNSAQKQIASGEAEINKQIKAIKGNPYLTDDQKTAAVNAIYESDAYKTLQSSKSQIASSKTALANAKAQAKSSINLKNNINMDTISAILKAQNFSMPAGYVTDSEGVDYLVRISGDATSLKEIQNMLIFDTGLSSVGKVYLKDVADVYVSDNSSSIYTKVNGDDGILVTFSKQSTYSTAKASDNLKETFSSLQEKYPGLKFTTMMDQGEYIYLVVDAIMENLLWGALFAIIVLAIFLKDIKPTLITLFSIPISIVFAIALMYFSGVTINIISLSGLAVAVGMLVDNSIVVIENIYRLKGKGVPIIQAAVSGSTQVAGAIAASTITTICVFVPIVFVEGVTRQLFTDMALTIAYSLGASLIVALTLVPALSVPMLKNAQPKPQKFLDKALGLYKKTVAKALDKKAIVLVGALVLLIVSIVAEVARGFIFIPTMNTPQMSVNITMPEGSSFEETTRVSDKVLGRIMKMPEVDYVGAMVSDSGSMSLSATGGSDVSMYVQLKTDENYSSSEVARKINNSMKDLNATVVASGDSSVSTYTDALGGSGISVEVYSDNLDDLQASAEDISLLLSKVDGVKSADSGIGETEPEIRFVIDKNKAMAKGLTSAQVYAAIADTMKNETTATTITSSGKDYEVVVKAKSKTTLTPNDIKNYKISVKTSSGTTKVKVSDVATIKETQTLTSISRYNQKRMLTVKAELKDGYNITLVTSNAQKAMENYKLKDGVTYKFTGANETIVSSMNDLLLMMALGILFVYLVMVAQFQSLKSPFIVMFTIPLAMTGGLLALFISGNEISVVSMIGFIMLCGIIVNNGIVLVDYINKLREEGTPKREAIIEAGVTRMRPILMTTITTVLGLSMMAFSNGLGTDLMRPVALVCIGGLIYATLLTLFVVPVMYDILNKKEMRIITEDELKLIDE